MKRALLLALAALLLTGCATSRVRTNQASAVAPQLVVERFLQAVNARDLVTMSRLFGTKSGPIGDTGSSFGCFWKKISIIVGGHSCVNWQEVELRMDVIAEILRHEDYRIMSESRVAGRDVETIRLGVTLEIRGRNRIPNVGFTLVPGGKGLWFLQEIELAKVTNTR